jgi:hypothetical protein
MAKKPEPIVAHGLTKRQFDEIKLRKLSNDLEMIPGNCASTMKDKHFKVDFADYQLPMHERLHYHVAMESRLYRSGDGERESVPMVQKFDKPSWLMMKESDTFKTYIAEFVHNPELEEKDAPLCTLKYTLTDEELAAQDKVEMPTGQGNDMGEVESEVETTKPKRAKVKPSAE